MMDLLKYIDARLGEASTWASLAVALTALHVNVDPGLIKQMTLWGIGLAAGGGVLLQERGTASGVKLATDVLTQIGKSVAAGQTALLAFLVLAVPLGACQAGADLLTAVGVSAPTAQLIAADTAEAGQLFCTDGTRFLAVIGVTVTDHGAAQIAQACAVAQVAGGTTAPATTPVAIAAPAGVMAVPATVPAPIAAAVAESGPTGS